MKRLFMKQYPQTTGFLLFWCSSSGVDPVVWAFHGLYKKNKNPQKKEKQLRGRKEETNKHGFRTAKLRR